MSQQDPVRWTSDARAPRELTLMIDAARRDAPSESELERMMSRLEALDRAPPVAGASASRLAIVGAGVLGALVIGIVLYRTGRSVDGPTTAPLSAPSPARTEPAASGVDTPQAAGQVDDNDHTQNTGGLPVAVDGEPGAASSEDTSRTARPEDAQTGAAPANKASIPSTPSELELVTAARDALARSAFADALAATRRHQRSYPQGVLAPEREAIAIEALARAGRRTEARRRLDALVRSDPHTSYRAHLQKLLGEEP